MDDKSIPILLVGVGMLVVLAVLAVLLVAQRQVLGSRTRGAFECSLQRRGIVGGERWQHGMMRFGTDRLRWFRAFSVRIGPEVVIRRGDIVEVNRRRLPARVEGGQEAYLLEFTLRDRREVHAVVDLVPGAALHSWLEAAPTGLVIGDAD